MKNKILAEDIFTKRKSLADGSEVVNGVKAENGTEIVDKNGKLQGVWHVVRFKTGPKKGMVKHSAPLLGPGYSLLHYYKSGPKKGQLKAYEDVHYPPISAAQELGSRGGKARAANLTNKQISEIGRAGAAARWQLRDVNGNRIADGQLQELAKRYIRSHRNSNAFDMMPGEKENPLGLARIEPGSYCRRRFMTVLRRIQKALDALTQRGEIAEVSGAPRFPSVVGPNKRWKYVVKKASELHRVKNPAVRRYLEGRVKKAS